MRKTLDVTIMAGTSETNRDHGKVFRITEMPAAHAERWAGRALRALARSGVPLPDDIEQAGMAELASVGFRALAGVDDATFDSLMDEIMGCVSVKEPKLIRDLTEDDIEEVSTRLTLRLEVFQLITGFSLAAVRQRLAAVGTIDQAA